MTVSFEFSAWQVIRGFR